MSAPPLELSVRLWPRSRYDAIDVPHYLEEQFGDVLAPFARVLYCSHHTTAGYLDPALAHRLYDGRGGVDPFVARVRRLFPEAAGYRHDLLQLRTELTGPQRENESADGDAHLTYIGCGLQNCVTYPYVPGEPVYFVDLDGVTGGHARTRTTTVVGFTGERPIAEFIHEVPVSRHAIDSVNLSAEDLGLRQRIHQLLASRPVPFGRIDLTLGDDEHAAAVTVNEYETLLMRHDLAEVLRDPLRFLVHQGRRALQDPRAVPAKSLGYARYDMVQLINRALDRLGRGGVALERVLSRLMALPAKRRLRLKRSVSLAVSSGSGGSPRLVCGRYQTPILIQWRAAPRQARRVRVTLHEFV